MFWEVELTQKVRIQPNKLASDIATSKIESELRNTVEGLVTPNSGIILLVKNIISTGPGKISFRTGNALFDVRYNAVVFHPRKGQIIDAVITKVVVHGVSASAGPLEVFISNKCMPGWYRYELESSSFQPNCGNVLTNNQGKQIALNANDSRKNHVLAVNAKVRVKIISTRPHTDSTRLIATGSIDDEFLGYIS